MVPVRSFLMHFNIPLKLKGERNVYNKKFRTLSYELLSILIWFLLIPLKILDLIGFYYFVDWLRRIIIKTRPLSPFEKAEAEKVFGSALDLGSIRICENSWFAKLGAKSTSKTHLGFVLFRTINFTRPLSYDIGITDMAWLIHELVHVIQFKHLGIQYIFEALRAQNNGGYGYGGLPQLQKSRNLSEFNLEQQADIARHYYTALITGSKNAQILKPFVEKIKLGKF
jgi:hypothetical protein